MKKGEKHTEEAKKKISIRLIGRTLSQDHKNKIGESLKGRKLPPFSKKHKRLLSEARKGKPFSIEHKKGISESNKGRIITDKTIEKIVNTRRRNGSYFHIKGTKEKISKTLKKYFREHPEAIESMSIKAKIRYPQVSYFYSKKNKGLVHYRSSYELAAFQILEQQSKVKSYKSEPFSIPYELDGVKHRTTPDILVVYLNEAKELIEVKSDWVLKDKRVNIKLWAMNDFAADRGWKFNIWTENELGLKRR